MNEKDDNGLLPLDIALSNDERETSRVLHKLGCTSNIRDDFNPTPSTALSMNYP